MATLQTVGVDCGSADHPMLALVLPAQVNTIIRNAILHFLGEEAILSEAHARRHGYNSEPVCGDTGDILTLEQLLTVLEQSQSALTASLDMITAEVLAREEQSFLGTTTLGQLIFFLYWHESYHAGQPEYLRQLAGKDDKVI